MLRVTGSDKSFITNVLESNACQSGYKARYSPLPEVFSKLEAEKMQGKYHQVMKQFQKLLLVLLDELLVVPSADQKRRD